MALSDSSAYSKCFHPELETVSEFLARFQLQNKTALAAAQAEGGDASIPAILLANALPINVLTDIQRRLKPITLAQATYVNLQNQLESAYGAKKTVVGAAVSFFTRKQKENESMETYSKSLNELAYQCTGYNDCCRDKMLRDIFISGLRSSKLMRELLADPKIDEKRFQDCVVLAKLFEQAQQDVEDIHPDTKFNVNKLRTQEDFSTAVKKMPNKDYKCVRCGTKGKHYVQDCFALKLECNKCSKMGHIARVCKSKDKQSTNYVCNEPGHAGDDVDDDPTEFVTINSVRHMQVKENHKLKYIHINQNPINISCKLNNKEVSFELDTGSYISTLGKEEFLRLSNAKLLPTLKQAKGYGNNVIKFLGETNVEVKFENCKIRHTFYIVESQNCLLYTSPSPRDKRQSRMPSSA